MKPKTQHLGGRKKETETKRKARTESSVTLKKGTTRVPKVQTKTIVTIKRETTTARRPKTIRTGLVKLAGTVTLTCNPKTSLGKSLIRIREVKTKPTTSTTLRTLRTFGGVHIPNTIVLGSIRTTPKRMKD